MISKMNAKFDNYKEQGSSCYFLDLRNSTLVIREISIDKDLGRSQEAVARLECHAEIMMGIHDQLKKKLDPLDPDKYHWDNTGDGHFCLMWTDTHAWDVLNNACSVANYLVKALDDYNKGQLAMWARDLELEKLEILFGMGIHSGGSLVYDNDKKRYAYGVVMNTAARVESQTKNFADIHILLTGYFKDALKDQQHLLSANDKRKDPSLLQKILLVSEFPLDIKDHRKDGHILFTIRPSDYSYFISNAG